MDPVRVPPTTTTTITDKLGPYGKPLRQAEASGEGLAGPRREGDTTQHTAGLGSAKGIEALPSRERAGRGPVGDGHEPVGVGALVPAAAHRG